MRELNLGMNFFGGHDTGIFAIFDDDCYGLLEERVTRFKHDALFPIDAIEEMLRYKRIDPKAIEQLHVGVATLEFENRLLPQMSYEMTQSLRSMLTPPDSPLFIKEYTRKKEALRDKGRFSQMMTFLTNPHGRRYLMMQLTGKKRPLREIVMTHLQRIFVHAKIDLSFYEHHLCHAYSSFYASDFAEAMIFSFDGYGDGLFAKLYLADKEGRFTPIGESANVYVPNTEKYAFADNGKLSVGNIYSIFTHLLGFTPLADEGKVEALAAFGDHRNSLYERLTEGYRIDGEHLAIRLDASVYDALFAPASIKHIFKELSREEIAAAVQRFAEETALSLLRAAQKRHPASALALCGGVTANVIMNLRIFETLFKHLFITPAMGDDGIAQGAALLKLFERFPQKRGEFRFPQMPYLGSAYTEEEVEAALQKGDYAYEYLGEAAWERAAELVASGKIGALFSGRMEFGPRALGNRTIVADVRNREIQKILNKEIKNRPLFQPFCPSILEEERERLFEKSYPNKHMTIAFRLKEEHAEAIPGAVHVDLTARAQFVEKRDNPRYYRFLKKIRELTGYGVAINTSFNRHGRTMVLSPEHALRDFADTNLDFLVMEGYLIQRGEDGV
ncbi:MAG: hypothetical protein B6D59_02560 [Campylobacteraceae bacterium 4484_4]|nr:MAG: hypothetical protein B6D59_02560 [Campylobacteraceae bacterium 4484_4]